MSHDTKRANVVGAHLRNIRNEVGFTHERLARGCQALGMNVSRSALAKIEAQIRLLKACELFIIAKVLNVPMERFYPKGFGDPRTPKLQKKHPVATASGQQWSLVGPRPKKGRELWRTPIAVPPVDGARGRGPSVRG